MVQFYPWFNFYFSLFLSMVTYDNELKTKENGYKDTIEPQHLHLQIIGNISFCMTLKRGDAKAFY